jgi:tetratricopeptide (TPR) repeat protein
MEEFLADNTNDLKLLARAVRNEGFRFIIIEHKHPKAYYLLRAWFADLQPERKVREVRFEGSNFSEVSAQLKEAEGEVVFLPDMDVLFFEENAGLAVAFNQRRDHYAKRNITFVSMVEPAGVKRVPEVLPDLWSMRSVEMGLEVVIDFSLIELPLKFLKVEEWVGEYVNHYITLNKEQDGRPSIEALSYLVGLLSFDRVPLNIEISTTLKRVVKDLEESRGDLKLPTEYGYALIKIADIQFSYEFYESAKSTYEIVLKFAQDILETPLEVFSTFSLIRCLIFTGEIDKGKKLFEQMRKRYEKVTVPSIKSTLAFYCAEIQFLEGDLFPAQQSIIEAIVEGEKSKRSDLLDDYYRLKSKIHAKQGDWRLAQKAILEQSWPGAKDEPLHSLRILFGHFCTRFEAFHFTNTQLPIETIKAVYSTMPFDALEQVVGPLNTQAKNSGLLVNSNEWTKEQWLLKLRQTEAAKREVHKIVSSIIQRPQ